MISSSFEHVDSQFPAKAENISAEQAKRCRAHSCLHTAKTASLRLWVSFTSGWASFPMLDPEHLICCVVGCALAAREVVEEESEFSDYMKDICEKVTWGTEKGARQRFAMRICAHSQWIPT